MKKRFIACMFLVACSSHGAPEALDAETRCAWCDGGFATLQDASEPDASEGIDAALELDAGNDASEPDASEGIDAALELDAGNDASDASEGGDAAADASEHPASEVCTPDGVPGGLCANAQCESACEASGFVVCCDDTVFTGGTFICWCER